MSTDVALFVHSFAGGGAETVAVVLANEIASRGYGVDLLVQHDEGPNRDHVAASVNVVDLNCRLRHLPWRLRSYLTDQRPRAMASFLTGFNVIAALSRTATVPSTLVLTEHSPIAAPRTSQAAWERLIRKLVPFTYRRADALVTVSSGMRKEFRIRGMPQSSILAIPNPLPLEEIAASLETQSVEHPFFGSGKPVITAVGRLIPEKDHMTLLRALVDLRQDTDAHLLVLGTGPLREELRSRSQELGLDEVVDFVGFVSPPWPWMAKSDVIVSSSLYEGWGNSLAEALAMGLPVVSTNAPFGPAEILGEGEFGRLVPVADAAALANGIRETLADPPAAERLRVRAAEWSVGRIADRYLEVLRLSTAASR